MLGLSTSPVAIRLVLCMLIFPLGLPPRPPPRVPSRLGDQDEAQDVSCLAVNPRSRPSRPAEP